MRERNTWPRKLGALVMALALCVGLLPVSALAADIEDWEDITLPQTSGEWTSKNNYDVSWYNTEDTSFTLSNAAELAGLAVIVKGLNGQDRDFFLGKRLHSQQTVHLIYPAKPGRQLPDLRASLTGTMRQFPGWSLSLHPVLACSRK